ncbi:GNAT family N-acetyltransferase [Radiobacillus kanasensis]|nr:GNAT family N-acetyltransferase [Radiobacillus kanasensis]
MKHLRTHLDEDAFLTLVEQAQENDHYQLAALYYEEEVVAVIGYMPMVTLYNGRFIWVCDLVTKPEVRSQGFGEQLLSHVEQWAKEQGFNKISLSSGLQRVDAHRFYEKKMDYRKVSYVFLKDL